MSIVAGVLFVLTGAGCVAYAAATAADFPGDPLVAIGALLVGLGLGLGGRSLVARRIALGSLAAMLLVLGYLLVITYRAQGASLASAEDVLLQFRLLVLALLGAVIVVLIGVARRVRSVSAFRAVDLLPLAGVVGALVIGVVWLVSGDEGLRPCSNGSSEACGAIAVKLIEVAERAPTERPTPWQERAAVVLEANECRIDRTPCSVQFYAVGTVAARAGREERAKQLFLRACDLDPNWCARAAQEPSIPWTDAERERLARRGPPPPKQ